MLARLLLFVCVAMGITILLTGAWPGPIAAPTQDREPAFLPQPVPLDNDIIGSGVSAHELVRKAIDKLDARKTPWLKTKIRQTMSDPECGCVAEGMLQRGPNQCARLSMRTGARRWTVVSDGEVAAHVLECDEASAKVNVEQLPARSESTAEREAFLTAKGCGGPLAMLQKLLPFLENAKLQTGLLDDAPVIQIHFDVNPSDKTMTIPARHANVYLDARTLWPWRVEWWGPDNENRLRSILRIEFLEPELNRELSVEECVRVFSYQPTEEPHTK